MQVLVITGPTAAGKTGLAMALADERPVHLISMDSAMVYRGMDIGTAKPTPDELLTYPHALVDVADVTQAYSAADFVRDADREVRNALALGRLPVIVGGTMMYLRAWREGLDDLPSADAALRAHIVARAQREGWAVLHQELTQADPEAAARIHPNNRQRLQRALEVIAVTGKPISAQWGAGEAAAERLNVRVCEVAVDPYSRTTLHARIEARFMAMLENGFIEEVSTLIARGDVSPALPALRAVGYRQVWEYLTGKISRAEMVSRGVAATRQLAKRQLTWLRGWPHVVRVGDPYVDRQLREVQVLLGRD